MIYFHIILHPAVHIYDFHIFITSSSSFHEFITNQFNDLLPVGLLAQWVRALHRSRRGPGFGSSTSLNFFFRLSFRNCKSCVYNCDDLLSYNSFTPQFTYFHTFITSKVSYLLSNALSSVSLGSLHENVFSLSIRP